MTFATFDAGRGSPRPWSRVTVIAASAALLAACALAPLEVDSSARAPVLAGFGANTLAISSPSAAARQWFDQGMAQAYAFNEVEAVRAFKAALAQDPSCAMCAWGVAYQLGPNINAPARGDVSEALRYVTHALRHLDGAPPRERALVEALALRYGHASEARNTAVLTAPICGAKNGDDPVDPLDIAYAQRMRALVARFPGDPDILSLYAEAEMVITRGDAWWDLASGQPVGRIGEVAQLLEQGLKQHVNHVGLNHYFIHATDALPVAARAEQAADRLASLAPRSPHLLHMPSHIFVQRGRYADAIRVNQQAVAADGALAEDLGRQGFSVSKDWRGHDGQFLWYAAIMAGQGAEALAAARASAARAAKADNEFGEFVRSRPLLTLLRMERWDELLREAPPEGDKGVAAVLDPYARGLAHARQHHTAEAAAALARLEPAAAALAQSHPSGSFVDKTFRGLALVALETLRAEVAFGKGQFDAALAHQSQAASAGKYIDETEPPMLAAGTRLALGDLQLRTGMWADAERTFRSDLAEHPHSGWALRGLAQSLQGQARFAQAAAAKDALQRAWRSADPDLRKAALI
jgi:tetratricopeptide (TPR) repeat protein